MAAWCRVAAILILLMALSNNVMGCDVDDMAVYKVKLQMLWSEERFPKDYPVTRPKAQWSQVFLQAHNASYALYHIGSVASQTVRNFAQYGKIDELVVEGDGEPRIYDQFSAPAVGSGTGETENLVFVDGAHSLVSFISRMIPSPDWFIGVDSVDLCVDSTWVDQVTLDLEPLDAGAASGLTFTAPRWETSPPEPITRHKPKQPNHPAAGFYYPELRELPSIAKVDFTKMKMYSKKELNDFMRQELIAKLKKKDLLKSFPRNRLAEKEIAVTNEVATKSHIELLKDLEEEPIGTPRPNNPDNNVEIVTLTPSTTTTTEREFDENLQNMDDVVLAIAHGKRLGLGKHLPRHFRSRLHHAVNRIQPNDCQVSEWGEWSPCSVTCGFGDKYRHRTVIRPKTKGGRDCPTLKEREHCGDVNSCVHIDYFEW